MAGSIGFWSRMIAGLLWLSAFGSYQSQAPGQTPSSDEARIREVANQFFTAYAKKDLDGLMKWWSTRSPEIDGGRNAAQSSFSATDSIDLETS